MSSSSRTTSVRYTSRVVAGMLTVLAGLISQVAEELWEVKDRKIKNLTKEDITIVDYKNLLVKNSTSPAPSFAPIPRVASIGHHLLAGGSMLIVFHLL